MECCCGDVSDDEKKRWKKSIKFNEKLMKPKGTTEMNVQTRRNIAMFFKMLQIDFHIDEFLYSSKCLTNIPFQFGESNQFKPPNINS